MSKVDFRNAYKSDHLGAIDLEGLIEDGKDLVFTITKVVHGQTRVAGKSGIFNVAYFQEDVKPLVLNSGNAKIVRKLSGSKSLDPTKWNYPIPVELYVDNNVRLGSDTVSGVRIKEFSQLISKPKIDVKPLIEKLTKAKNQEELKTIWLSLSKTEQAIPEVFSKKDELKDSLK